MNYGVLDVRQRVMVSRACSAIVRAKMNDVIPTAMPAPIVRVNESAGMTTAGQQGTVP